MDPYARADFFLTFSDEEVDVEEGFITFTSLPAGFLLKVGQDEGLLRQGQHAARAHPALGGPAAGPVNLLGGDEGLADAGLSLSRLFPNSFLFLEATARGLPRRGGEPLHRAASAQDVALVGRLRAYRDLTESTNLDLGGSVAHGTNEAGTGFHTTALRRRRDPPLAAAAPRHLPPPAAAQRARVEPARAGAGDRGGRAPAAVRGDRTAKAFGSYVSADYQLARRWFAGARYDWSERARDPDLRDRAGSLLLTWWPSEFSQVRGQYRRTSLRARGSTANEFLFQFLFSIGAHGAHPF